MSDPVYDPANPDIIVRCWTDISSRGYQRWMVDILTPRECPTHIYTFIGSESDYSLKYLEFMMSAIEMNLTNHGFKYHHPIPKPELNENRIE
jgi:hypothetical protein